MTPLQLTMLHNSASLTLGIAAIVFASFAIISKRHNISQLFSVVSLGACACSLLLELLEIGNRVSTGDFSAIADTIRAVIIYVSAVIGLTIILNAIAVVRASKK